MINPLSNVRPSERRLVYGATITLWGILAGHSLLETTRDALFLGSLPPSRLPWVYLAIAVVSITVMQLQSRWTAGRGNQRVLGSLLVLSAFVTAGFWILLDGTHPPWVLASIYIWSGVFATLIVTRFWIVVEDVFTVTQAKRVFAMIGTGSVAGAITGSGLARILSEFMDPRHFLLVAAGIIFLTGALPLLLLRGSEETERGGTHDHGSPHWRDAFHSTMSRPYVQRLMGLVLVSTLVLTIVDYLFKSIVARQLAPDQLANFFATTYLSLNLVSLLLQVTLVGTLMRSVGLHRVLGLTPFLLVIASGFLVVIYTMSPLLLIIPALALKGIDGSLRYSLHRTSLETLFVPLSGPVRNQVKTFIDVVGQRGGQAVASLLILLVIMLPAGSEVVLAAAVIALSISWIRVALDIRRHYLDLFRDTLGGRDFMTEVDFPELDLASLESLLTHLNSNNDVEVIVALDMLAEQDRTHVVPALILYHPSAVVVNKALQLFSSAQRSDTLPILERLSDHEDASVRASVLRARAQLAPDIHRQLNQFLDDPSPLVRATALVSLAASGWFKDPAEAEIALSKNVVGSSIEERLALVRSIQQQPDPIHTALLIEFAKSSNRALQRETAIAMKAVANNRFIEPLIEMLPNREVRQEARTALVSLGDEALEALDRALGDESLPQNIRRHIPRTVHRFEPAKAVVILMKHLLESDDGLIRFKVLRGLGSLRNRERDLPLDRAVLREGVEQTLTGSLQILDWTSALIDGAKREPARATIVHELLVHTLQHKESHAKERLFRLLGLLFPEEDWERIYRGIGSNLPEELASSHELIEAVVQPPLRPALLALVDDIDDAAKLRAGSIYYQPRAWSYEEVLEAFLTRGSLGLRCITIHHVAELGLERFRGQIESMGPGAPAVQQQVVTRALALLDQPEPETMGRE